MPAPAPAYFVPAAHALHMVDWVERFGVPRKAIFTGFSRDPADLEDAEARVSVSEVEFLVQRARKLTGVRALGLHLGLQMRVSVHGYLGFAAMTANTVGDALDLAVRFAPTLSNAFALSVAVEDDEAALTLHELAHFGEAHDVVVFTLLWGIACMGAALTGRSLQGRAELSYSRPDYFAEIEDQLGGSKVLFDQPATRLVFDRALLMAPIIMADATALQLAKAQCERALEAVTQARPFADQVRSALLDNQRRFRPLEEVASALHVSERTLKRRLNQSGTTFSTLLEQAKVEQARRLLLGPLTIEQIAERLGYSDAPNFTRAFRRWTGQTPSRARQLF